MPTTKNSATIHRSWARASATWGEIQELAGCDLLTISPQLLGELQKSTAPLTRKLSPEMAKDSKIEKLPLDEKKFPLAVQRKRDGHRKLPRASACSTPTRKNWRNWSRRS